MKKKIDCEFIIHVPISYNKETVDNWGLDCSISKFPFECPFLEDNFIQCQIKSAFKNRPNKCRKCEGKEVKYWDQI